MSKKLLKAFCACICCLALLAVSVVPASASVGAADDLKTQIETSKKILRETPAPPNFLLEKQENFWESVQKTVAISLQKDRLEAYSEYYTAARSCYSSAMTQLYSASRFLEEGYEDIAREYLARSNGYMRMGKGYDDAALYIWRDNLEAAKEKLYEISKVSVNIAGLSGKVLNKLGAAPAGFIFDKAAIGMEYWLDQTYKGEETASRDLYKNMTEFLFDKAYTSWLNDVGIKATEQGIGIGRSGLGLLGLNVPAADMMFESPPDVFCSDTCKLIKSFIASPEGSDRAVVIRELAAKTGLTESQIANITETIKEGDHDGGNAVIPGSPPVKPSESAVAPTAAGSAAGPVALLEGRYYPVNKKSGAVPDLTSSDLTGTMNDYMFSQIDWIEFRSGGKAAVSVMGIVQTGDYEIKGGRVYVSQPGRGEVSFTIVDAVTLHGETTGFIGDYKKKT